MFKKLFILMFALLLIFPLVNADPPITSEFVGDTGLAIETNIQEYYKINEGAEIHIHVFNRTNGARLSGDVVSCEVELADPNGTLIMTGNPTVDDGHFHMSRPPNIITEAGMYALTIVCNDSTTGGYTTHYFKATIYGEGLTEGRSINFNFGMLFLMILFLMALIGTFKIENYIGKFVCYWITHVFFIVGTFSVWQFNIGHSVATSGLAGIFKVLFYTSTIAVFPMILLSIVWIFYIHTMTDEVKSLMDRGMNSEEAWDRAKTSKKGWFGI